MSSLVLAPLLSVAPFDGGLPGPLTVARTFTMELASGSFDAAAARLSPCIASTITAPKLAMLWGRPVEMMGPFQRLDEAHQDGEFIIATCIYERGTQKLKITVDAEQKVASVRFGPALRTARARFNASST